MNVLIRRNSKYPISIRNFLEELSIAILISSIFFMHYGIKILTYAYLPLEIMAVFLLLRNRRWRIKIDSYVVFISSMEVFIFITTIMNGRLNYSYLCMFGATIFLIVFIRTNIKEKAKELISLFDKALYLLFVLDVISILICLLTGNHTNANFGLAGHKNYHAFLFILTLGFKLMNNRMYQRRMLDRKVLVIAFISIILEFMVDSMSGVIAVGALIVLCFLMTKKRWSCLNLTTLTVGLLVLNYVLIFAVSRIQWMQNLLTMIGRDAGLTGRGQLWTSALNLIAQHPMYGYGYSQTVAVWNPVENVWADNHCHNFFLNLVLTGGVLYFVIVVVLIFIIARRIKKNESEVLNILAYTIGCYLLLGVSEIIVNVNTMFWPLLTFGFYCRYLFDNGSNADRMIN